MSVFVIIHLSTIVPVLLLGPVMFLRAKGDSLHRLLGKVWVGLMVVACTASFGLTHNGGLSGLHGLAAFTLFASVRGVVHARAKRIKRHRAAMLGAYVGTVIAFFYALLPGRLVGGAFWALLGVDIGP